MTSSIPNADKKEFIRWFLKNYQLKRREGVWILNYLLTSDTLLSRVRFTDDVHKCPRAIVMSTIETNSIPFRFYKGNMMTNEAEKAFYDLRNKTDHDIYIQLNFSNNPPNPLYLAVIEANPYVPSSKPVREIDAKIASHVMQESQVLFQERVLLNLIDRALDEGDEQSFHQYVAELKKLQRK